MSKVSQAFSPIVQFFKPTPKPEDYVTWAGRKLGLARDLAVDASQRLFLDGIEGVDKTEKLAMAGLNGIILSCGGVAPRASAILTAVSSANEFFGATGVFGRWEDVIGWNNKTKKYAVQEKTPVKGASATLLAGAKTAEAARYLDKLDFLHPKRWAAFDANYLGGIASKIGGIPLVQKVGLTTLTGTKNCLVILSASYGILENVINLMTLKVVDAQSLAKIGLGIANDTGKIVMSLWFYWFTVTWTFVGVAATVATVGITKVLFDSYSKTGRPDFLK